MGFLIIFTDQPLNPLLEQFFTGATEKTFFQHVQTYLNNIETASHQAEPAHRHFRLFQYIGFAQEERVIACLRISRE